MGKKTTQTPPPERDQDISLRWVRGKWHCRATAFRPGDTHRKKVWEGSELSAAIAAATAARHLALFFEQGE